MSEAFRQAGPPANVQYYLNGILSGWPVPAFPGNTTVLSAIANMVNPIWSGTLSPALAIAQGKQAVQAVLDEYVAKW